MRPIAFYISGHGYGHAVRTGEVIRALQRLQPDRKIFVRTRAPRRMLPAGIEYGESDFEPRVVERRAGVVIDPVQTLTGLKNFLERWDDVVTREVTFARAHRVALIVSDIPAIAGDVAHAAGVPCVGISNFTWDWIFEPYASGYLDRFEQGYSRMDALLRLPFHQPERLNWFRRIVDVPLIARKSSIDLSPYSSKPKRVLLGSRAQVSADVLDRAQRTSPDFEFVTVAEGMNFTDTLAGCDLVIAKLGYSMVAECIAARKPLLYPPRENFREESILQQHVFQHIPALPIPLQDFYSGDWRSYLLQLLAMPAVQTDIRTDGAAVCAELIAVGTSEFTVC